MLPFFLKRGNITPIHQSVGIIPVSRILLNKSASISMHSIGKFFKNSFLISSRPGALPFLSLAISLAISSTLIALLSAELASSDMSMSWCGGIVTPGASAESNLKCSKK